MFERTCPYLLEGDHLLLSREFALKGESIVDGVVGVRHHIENRGFELMRMLQLGASPTSLLKHAQHRGLEDAQLYELLGFLNMIGALERSRSIRDWVRMGSHGLWFLGFVSRFAALGFRRPASLKNIVLLTCRACIPIIAAVLVVGAAYYLLGISSMATTIAFGLLSLAIFVGSVTLHEVGHAVILWKAGIACSVMRSGMRVGLLHRRVERALERKAALAGPLAASLPLFVIAAVTMAFAPIISITCVTISIFHLASLLPWYGDGISIWKSEGVHGRS